jgi:hypothetical protein
MANDLLQCRQLYLKVVLRRNFLRDRLIVFGLGLVGIGNGRLADIE